MITNQCVHFSCPQDGRLTNINFKEKVVDPKNLERNILEGVYVGRKPGGNAPDFQKKLSDVNIWDFALEEKVMKAWTACE